MAGVAAAIGEAALSTAASEGLQSMFQQSGQPSSATSGGTSGGVGGYAQTIIGASGTTIDLDALLTGGGTLALEGMIDRDRYNRTQQVLDRQFQEDLRRFNLNYALQQYSLRHRITIEEAQLRYQQEQRALGLQQYRGYQRPMEAMSMVERQMALREAADRLERNKIFGKAFYKGLARGLSRKGGQ